MNFYVQDQKAWLIPKQTRTEKVVATLTENTGLIGSPALYENIGGSKQKDKNKPDKGATIECQLNGAITAGSTVQIFSDKLKGLYKVISATHSGDYEGTNWRTKAEVAEVQFTVQEYAEFPVESYIYY